MSTLFPPSKLLPAMILASTVALAIKTTVLVTTAPSLGALWAGTAQALDVASTARVMSQAQAAPTPTIPQVSPAASPAPGLPSAPAQPAASAPPVEAVPAPATAASDATQEVNLRRSQIEEREQQLAEREAALAATDKHLTDRVNQLLAIQAHLESLESERKQHEEANWVGLVKLYEGMRPRDAAAIFNALDKTVLIEILDRMKPAKASPIIALMEPESARQVTADLAAKRTRSTTVIN